MKKITLALTLCFIFVTTTVVIARPAKDDFDGKTAGNTGFANIVDSNFPNDDINGWVRYSKNGKCLQTTWNIWGLEPFGEYQLKLHSKEGDTNIANACGSPNVGAIWQCGFWDGESFLVIDTVIADADGYIGYGVKECRLPSGDYEDAQFIVTQNSSPWSSAWTWENSPETDDSADNWNGDISTFSIK